MTDYQITCVTKSIARPGEHGHIVVVGTVQGEYFTAQEADRKIRRQQDTFHTVSPSTGRRVTVMPYRCPDCGLLTLKSLSDGIWDDNLDSLEPCLKAEPERS